MSTKVLVSFPEDFLTEVDQVAQKEHRSRSELIREALRLYIKTQEESHRPADRAQVRRAVAAQDALSRLAPGTGEDSTIEIRRWREAR